MTSKLQATKILRAVAALAIVAAIGTQASAANTTLAQWTFNSAISTAGPFAAEVGTGSALGFHTGASTYSGPAGNGPGGASFSSNTWAVGDYYQFQSSTTGFSNIGLQFDQTGSNTGPRDFKIQYSTDGTTFTDFTGGAYAIQPNGTPAWSNTAAVETGLDTYVFNLSSITALNEKASVFFRLTNSSTTSVGPATGYTIPPGGGPVQAGGTNRVDNVYILGDFSATTTPVPQIAAPVLPQAGDVVLGFGSPRSKATIDLVRGASTLGGGAEPAPFSSWRTPLQQSVRFDNLGSTLHNVQGNLLGTGDGLTSGTSSATNGGTIWSNATQGTAPFGMGQLLATTGATATLPVTQTRLSGLSVSPGNDKIAVAGTDSGKVIVYNYTAGNSLGAGAALANARETSTSDLTPLQNQGTAWLNNDTALALSTAGKIYEVAVTPSAVTATEKNTITLPATAPTLTSLYYNTNASKYVWAMTSSFAASTTTNTLYVLNPATNYSTVASYDFSSGIDTAREIALNASGDLFISANGSKMYVLKDAADDPLLIVPTDTKLWYTSSTFNAFNGFDIGFTAAGQLGDYNSDGIVDAADYAVWRNNVGQPAGTLPNDNTGLAIGSSQYDLWKTNFGRPPGAGSGDATAANVPEPASLMLLVVGLAAFACRRATRG